MDSLGDTPPAVVVHLGLCHSRNQWGGTWKVVRGGGEGTILALSTVYTALHKPSHYKGKELSTQHFCKYCISRTSIPFHYTPQTYVKYPFSAMVGVSFCQKIQKVFQGKACLLKFKNTKP